MLSNLIVAATLLINSLTILNFNFSGPSPNERVKTIVENDGNNNDENTTIRNSTDMDKKHKLRLVEKSKPDFNRMSNSQKVAYELLSIFRHMRLAIACWNLLIMFCMVFLFGK